MNADPVPPNRVINRLTTGRGTHHSGPTIGSSSDFSRPVMRTRVAAQTAEDRFIDSVAMTVEQWNELNASSPQQPFSNPQTIPSAHHSRIMESARLAETARLASRVIYNTWTLFCHIVKLNIFNFGSFRLLLTGDKHLLLLAKE